MLKRLRPPQRQAALITLTNHFTSAGFLKIKSLPKVTPKLLKQLAPVDVFLTVFDVSGKTCRPSEAMPDDRIQQHSAGDAASLTGQRQAQFSNSPTALRFRAASTRAIRQSGNQAIRQSGNQAINLADRTSALPRGAEHAVRVRYSHLAALPL